MTTVTLSEARDLLPDLARRAAGGEDVVLTDGGRPVATLTAPPPQPPTAEEVAEQQARAEECVRRILATWVEDGYEHRIIGRLREIWDRRPVARP